MFHDFTKTESGQLMNIGITMLMFRKDDCKKSSALLSRGINVLESKSELEKALAKQRLAAEQKQKEAEVTSKEKEETNPEFKRVLAERAKRLERLEAAEDCGDAEEREDEGQAKAKEVFQRLEGRMEEGVRAGKKSVPTRGELVGKVKVEVVGGNSSSPEEQSEFAKVFAALRGGGRVD